MTRYFAPSVMLFTSLLASPALAHVGHIGEVAGHGHIGGILLIGLAAGIGLWAALKGKKSGEAEVEPDEEEVTEEPDDLEPQEA